MRNELLATLAAGAIALGTMSGTAAAHRDVADRSDSRSDTRLSSRGRDFVGLDSRDRDFIRSDTRLSSRDRRFIKKAARGAYFEIAAGQLAATKAVTPEVRALGTRLAADHTTGLASIVALAETYAVRLPETMSDDQQDELDDVSSHDGLDFDDAFTELAKKDHRHDVSDFRREARKGRNAEVRAFAGATMPVLKEHLAAAKAANDVVEQQQEEREGDNMDEG